jgi:hypothetical protein
LALPEERVPNEAKKCDLVNVLATAVLAIPNAMNGFVTIPILIYYQRVLTDHFAVTILPYFVYSTYPRMFQYALLLGVDWHPFDLGLNGFFVGVFLDFAYDSIRMPWAGPAGSHSGVGAGLSVGYQLTLFHTLLIEFSYAFKTPVSFDWEPSSNNGWREPFPPRVEIGLGYKFSFKNHCRFAPGTRVGCLRLYRRGGKDTNRPGAWAVGADLCSLFLGVSDGSAVNRWPQRLL